MMVYAIHKRDDGTIRILSRCDDIPGFYEVNIYHFHTHWKRLLFHKYKRALKRTYCNSKEV